MRKRRRTWSDSRTSCSPRSPTSRRDEQSRSALLPQVGVVARQGYLTLNLQGFGIDLANTPRLIGPFGSMDARFILTQDLFNIANVRSWQSYSSHRDSSRYLVENADRLIHKEELIEAVWPHVVVTASGSCVAVTVAAHAAVDPLAKARPRTRSSMVTRGV